MADSMPSRRSTRGKAPNKKYSYEAFEESYLLASHSEPSSATPPKLDNSEDEDFPGDAAVEESEADEDVASVSDIVSNGSETTTPEEEHEDSLDSRNNDLHKRGVAPVSLQKLRRHLEMTGSRRSRKIKLVDGQHSRGLPPYDSHQSKYAQVKYLIGTDPEDLKIFMRGIDKWIRDVTLPTQEPNKQGWGGLGTPFFQKSLDNTNNYSNWLYSFIDQKISKFGQSTRILDATHGTGYLPKGYDHHSFLIGPYSQQQKHIIGAQEVVSIDAIWCPTISSEGNDVAGRDKPLPKSGWLLNAGSEVRCLDWAPSKPGAAQYLAIATTYVEPIDLKLHSAFKPSSPYPACIRLWRFHALTQSTNKISTMDMEVQPHAVQTICTNWGAPKHIRWCPVSPMSQHEAESSTFIGLLAGIWSDGCVRVLAIELNEYQDSSAAYVLYERAAFTSRPHNTIYTCLAWTSASELAVGCANGFVAIWNLAELRPMDQAPSLATRDNNLELNSYSAEYRPFFYHCLHQSYVLSLSTGFPSHRYLLVTCSIDGYFRLTDIRNPTVDFVCSQRARAVIPAIDYHPHLQSFITADDNDFIRAVPIRRFQSQHVCAKTGGHVTSISVGKVHASTLIASADGTVIAINPIRKVLDGKAEQYQQIWFRHEWVQNADSREDGAVAGTTNCKTKSMKGCNIPRRGVSRITESYSVESMRTAKADSKLANATFGTIFERESAISQVAWNPNLHCGSWAAAGMGTGLVRIEDLAI